MPLSCPSVQGVCRYFAGKTLTHNDMRTLPIISSDTVSFCRGQLDDYVDLRYRNKYQCINL